MKEPIPFILGRLSRRWGKLLGQRLEDLPLTRARWTTMMFLHHSGGGLFQRELANLMGVNQPTLVRMLDTLETQQLVQRRFDPQDRRVHHLHLTEGGDALVAQINRRAKRLRQTLLDGVSDNELATATRVLSRILDNSERL